MEMFNVRISGGLGKNVMGTAIVKQLKVQHPKSIIHVSASYPDVFINLPFVDKVFPYAPIPYFRDEHKEFDVLECEPYIDLEYRSGKVHLIDAWCRRLGLDIPTDKTGTILLDDQEKNIGDAMFFQLKLDRPLIAFQYIGGTSNHDPNKAMDPTVVRQYRDIPFDIAQEIVNKLVGKGMAVLHIGLPTERQLQNTIPISAIANNQVMNTRYLFALLNKCQGAILNDSFAQHAWVALGKEKALVLWGGTNPTNLGYSKNHNMFMKESCVDIHCGRPDSFMYDVIGNGQMWKCPHGAKCMKFNTNTVVDAFMNNFQTMNGAKQ